MVGTLFFLFGFFCWKFLYPKVQKTSLTCLCYLKIVNSVCFSQLSQLLLHDFSLSPKISLHQNDLVICELICTIELLFDPAFSSSVPLGCVGSRPQQSFWAGGCCFNQWIHLPPTEQPLGFTKHPFLRNKHLNVRCHRVRKNLFSSKGVFFFMCVPCDLTPPPMTPLNGESGWMSVFGTTFIVVIVILKVNFNSSNRIFFLRPFGEDEWTPQWAFALITLQGFQDLHGAVIFEGGSGDSSHSSFPAGVTPYSFRCLFLIAYIFEYYNHLSFPPLSQTCFFHIQQKLSRRQTTTSFTPTLPGGMLFCFLETRFWEFSPRELDQKQKLSRYSHLAAIIQSKVFFLKNRDILSMFLFAEFAFKADNPQLSLHTSGFFGCPWLRWTSDLCCLRGPTCGHWDFFSSIFGLIAPPIYRQIPEWCPVQVLAYLTPKQLKGTQNASTL